MKNTYKLTTATALAVALSATPSNANNAFFKSGFVAGAAIGYSKMGGKIKNESNEQAFNPAPLSNVTNFTNSNINSSSLIGSLFAGYRHITESGFVLGCNLGLSVDGNSKKISGKNNNTTFNTKLTRQFQITPAFLIGKTLAERWMIFTELGLSISRFKLKSTSTDTRPAPNATIHTNKSFTRVGFAPAIGTEYAINQNLAVMGKLTYEYFGNMKKNIGNTDVTPGAIQFKTDNNVHVRTSYFTAKVGVLYKF